MDNGFNGFIGHFSAAIHMQFLEDKFFCSHKRKTLKLCKCLHHSATSRQSWSQQISGVPASAIRILLPWWKTAEVAGADGNCGGKLLEQLELMWTMVGNCWGCWTWCGPWWEIVGAARADVNCDGIYCWGSYWTWCEWWWEIVGAAEPDMNHGGKLLGQLELMWTVVGNYWGSWSWCERWWEIVGAAEPDVKNGGKLLGLLNLMWTMVGNCWGSWSWCELWWEIVGGGLLNLMWTVVGNCWGGWSQYRGEREAWTDSTLGLTLKSKLIAFPPILVSSDPHR